MALDKIDFEKSLGELEKIIAKLESDECTLEESIYLFEQGMKHTESCRKALDNAKKRIIDLTEIDAEENAVD